MITTITLNPSLDLTLEVGCLSHGVVNRAATERLEAAGKGVNLAMALAANGHKVRAMAAMDPVAVKRYRQLLPFPKILEDLHAEGIIRTNVSIVEPNGVVTKVNGPGPRYDDATLRSVIHDVEAHIRGSRWVVLSGSLPPGCPEDLYAYMVGVANDAGCKVAIDSDGRPLRHGVKAGPDLVKVNRIELETLVGRQVATFGDVIDAGTELADGGVGTVLCSLGTDGAIMVCDADVCHAWAGPIEVDSHVGAGDAFLAGYLAQGSDGADALRAAVAWGIAACRLPGSQMPGPNDITVDEVTVEASPNRATPLTAAR